MDGAPTLLVAAHGTRSDEGTATIAALVELVRTTRPGLTVEHCFVDVRGPTLAEALTGTPGPAVIVPALLSTGYHVRNDIPSVTAGRADVRIARHLGPDRLISLALAQRLAEARGARGSRPHHPASRVVLVATGSTDPDARVELEQAAADLAVVLGEVVTPAVLPEIAGPLLRADVVPYLLAEGYFASRIAELTSGAGGGVCAAPIGAHPALTELVLRRYDEVVS
jgi:sirohydrochlorin ferrochelatase